MGRYELIDDAPSGRFQIVDTPQEKSLGASLSDAARDATGGMLRGAGSIGATLLWPIDKTMDLIKGDRGPNVSGLVTGKQPLSRNEERRMQMTQGLKELGVDTEGLPFKGAKILTEIAGTAGVGGALGNAAARLAPSAPIISNALSSGGFNLGDAAVKGAGALPFLQNTAARVAGGAITGGVSAGLVDPSQAASGAAIGAALPPGVQLAGKIGSGLGSALKNTFAVAPQNRALAEKAINEYGIPLGVADITSSPMIKATRSVLNDAPLTGGIGATQKEAVQGAFNKAVGSTFGAPETKLTAEVVDAAKKRMGAEFDRIWGGNNLQVDPSLMQKMASLEQQAAKLPQGDAHSLTAELKDLYGKIKTGPNGEAIIPGDVANKFQQHLRMRADSSQGLKNELSDLRQSIINTFNKSVSAEDAAALTLNRSQYKAFKTVEPILNSAEAGVAGRLPGDIPASLLPQAVNKSYSQVAGTPLADLSQIGSQFIVDRVLKTGGGIRAGIQNSAIGSAIGTGAILNPLAAAAVIPAGMGVNKMLGSPALARALTQQAATDPSKYAGLLQMFAQQQPVMAQGLLGRFNGQTAP